jgi:putative two-component system response regulator
MAVADVYDALISKRAYKPAFTHEQALAIMGDGRGRHFDPDVLDAFFAIEARFADIAAEYSDAGAD